MFDRIGRSLVAFVVLALVGVGAAKAAPTPLVSSFGDFALRDPTEPTKPGPPDYYASTGPEPEWQIVQWNIPGGRLSPFLGSLVGDRQTLISIAPEASVRIMRGPRGRSVQFSQDGAVLPCSDLNGSPRESDLFFGPKDRSAAGPNALKTGRLPLAGLRALVLTTVAGVRYGMTASPKGCAVNQGAAIAAVVLNNLSQRPPQTFFYKVSLNMPCGSGAASRVHVCAEGTKRAGFYFKQNPFGVDDWLPLLGQPLLKDGEYREITLDLLPRLRQLIALGPEGMDHDPSHWEIDNVYAGQHIWGDFRLASTWERFQILAYPR